MSPKTCAMPPMMLRRSGVYAIRNAANGNVYIGSAVNISRRWREHRHQLNRGKHTSPILRAAWQKYGTSAFVFEVVEYVDNRSMLIEREQHWIDALRPAYNVVRHVRSAMLGRTHSEETKAKIARANLGNKSAAGRVLSAESRAKLSASAKGNKNALGVVRSEEYKAARRGNKHGLGYKHTEAARRSMSQTRTGMKRGPYRKAVDA